MHNEEQEEEVRAFLTIQWNRQPSQVNLLYSQRETNLEKQTGLLMRSPQVLRGNQP